MVFEQRRHIKCFSTLVTHFFSAMYVFIVQHQICLIEKICSAGLTLMITFRTIVMIIKYMSVYAGLTFHRLSTYMTNICALFLILFLFLIFRFLWFFFIRSSENFLYLWNFIGIRFNSWYWRFLYFILYFDRINSRVFLQHQLWIVNYYCVKSLSNDLSNENIKTGVSRGMIFQK